MQDIVAGHGCARSYPLGRLHGSRRAAPRWSGGPRGSPFSGPNP
ncbi:Hypothetical protein A7982_04107 [Minicystis rosea]|nr:Hypothetical protein A7982_04107 [Minicystis rosea]